MRDREKRMGHDILNGERMVYSRKEKGELGIELRMEWRMEWRIEWRIEWIIEWIIEVKME